MFAISEFALESILREGLEDMKSDTDLRLEDIFGRLRLPDIATKYGSNEIKKIKEILMKTPIHIVQAQNNLMEMKMPCISIHMLADTEAADKAGFNDYDGEQNTPINPQVIVASFTATSYDSATGRISIPDSVDLSQVYENRFFKDGLGQSHLITNDLSNVPGDKYITIEAEAVGLVLTGCTIVSAINQRVHQVDYIPTDENIMIGIHCENSLLTKYLYYVVRYLLYRKKDKFMEYQLQLSKYNGSDFALVQMYMPESGCYSRWITAQFVTYNFWRSDELIQIDAVNPNVGGDGPYVEIECDFIPDAYDPLTGVVSVPDNVNLQEVENGDWFFDGVGSIFRINGSVDNTPGAKSFKINAGQTVDLTAGCIKRKYTIRAEAESEREDEQDMTWETDIP